MFRLDQKGVSLPLVLAILGLVIANTYYFMDVQQSTKEQNIKRSAELEDNSEKLRLASFLSDVKVCSSDNSPATPLGIGNTGFGGRTIAQINDLSGTEGSTFPLKKANIVFLQTAIATGPPAAPNYQPLYGRGTLRFLKYQIVQTDPVTPNADLSKNFSLLVTYSIMDRKDQVTPSTKTKVIRLPIYIVFEFGNPSGKITTCYTEADASLSTVETVVKKACNGDAAIEGTNALNGLIECQHNIFDKPCANSEVLIGLNVNLLKKEEYVCGHPKNIATTAQNCPQTPMREFLSNLLDGDEFVCQTTDTGCSNGQMFVMGTANSPVCVSNCAVNELFKGVGSNGIANCIPRPKQCPVGQYTVEITAGGEVTCAPYNFLNKTCSAGTVATDINMAAGSSASADTIFNCRAITKDKVCAEPTTVTTFVTSFTTPVPSCATF